MKKTAVLLLMVLPFISCKKEIDTAENSNLSQPEIQQVETNQTESTNSVTPAAIAYRRSHTVSNNLVVPALYVMNSDGSGKTVVYTNYTKKNRVTTIHTPDFPTWKPNGQKLCFVLNKQDLYRLDIDIVNGVTQGSNPVKIADGPASGGTYGKGVWQPGTNQIATTWSNSTGTTSIRMIPAAGGTSTTVYTSAAGFTINHPSLGTAETHLTFNRNGSMLAFFEREISTGYLYLKVFSLTANAIVQSIDLSYNPNEFWAITNMDWANTAGSSLIAFTAEMNRCIGVTALHKLYQIDINASNPVPALIKIDVTDCSWSPDDTQIAFSVFSSALAGSECNLRQYQGGIKTITLSNNAQSSLESFGAYNADWKR